MSILITGASGFVGSALVKRLGAQGRLVHPTDRVAGAVPTTGMDVTDGRAVLALFKQLRPKAVIHLAAMVDDRGRPEVFQQVNVGGTQNVLDAAAATGVERLVHVSSIAALGFDPGHQADETTPLALATGSPYFDTKAASEKLVRDAHEAGAISATVVRPGDVWGPGSGPWVLRLIEMMQRRMPVLIDGGRGRICHCWIDNLVDGLVLALDHPDAPGGVFTVHDGAYETRFSDYVTRLATAAGLSAPTRSLPLPAALAVAGISETAQRLFGVTPPMTRGAVRYVCRDATYSLASSENILGFRPKVSLDVGMERLAIVLQDGRA